MEDERPYLDRESLARLTAIDPQAKPRMCTECLSVGVETRYPPATAMIVKHRHGRHPEGTSPRTSRPRMGERRRKRQQGRGVLPGLLCRDAAVGVCPMCG